MTSMWVDVSEPGKTYPEILADTLARKLTHVTSMVYLSYLGLSRRGRRKFCTYM